MATHKKLQLSSNQEHSCEICGLSGLTDDNMREHTRTCHVEGSAQCPFCGLSGVVPAELLLHVNQAHLDYLTPENELMSFIDDQSPSSYFSIDGDSDSLSDCDFPPLSTLKDTSSNHNQIMGNGMPSTTNAPLSSDHGIDVSDYKNAPLTSLKPMPDATMNHSEAWAVQSEYLPSGSSSRNNGLKSNIDHTSRDISDGSGISREYVNGLENKTEGCGQGSPLRSRLELNLKTNIPAPQKPSPLQCPMCSYSSISSSVLEEHINRSHFDPLSPTSGAISLNSHHTDTLTALACPICQRNFESTSDLELHVNIEHRDILSPARIDAHDSMNGGAHHSCCPVCALPMTNMSTQEMELHIDIHFPRSPKDADVAVATKNDPNLEMQAQKLREQREFEMLRAQYGMDDQGNFREQSAASMQRAVYAGEMSVADYYERQVGLRAAESHGIDDGTSCTKSVTPRVMSLSALTPNIVRSLVCTAVDHYASSYGDKGWGCGYRNLQMLLSSLLQNTTFNEALYSAWGTHAPSRTSMPSISRLQKMVEAAWAQGFDVQGSEQLGCKLYNTRKWIGATEVVTVLSWLRLNCQLIDFHRPTSSDGRHPELFKWVYKYFEEPKAHTPPLYLQHQGHSRTIIGIEQHSNGLHLLILDPSHGPRQVAALGSSQESLQLIRRSSGAMRAPQYQLVAIKGLIDTEEQYQASKILRSLRIPPDC